MLNVNFKLPFSQRRVFVGLSRPQDAAHTLGLYATNLRADLFHRGKWQGHRDLGSGLITHIATLAIANDFNWANPSGAVNTMIALSNNHGTGTGATAAAATDIKLQTPSTNGGQTLVAGAQSVVQPTALGTNSQQYKTIATISYTGSEAVTEWGLFNNTTLTRTTGSPFTTVTATVGTVTGTPLTASSATVRGEQMNVVEAGTTTSYGLVFSNSTSAFTFNNWYKTSDGSAGTTPGNTETYTIRPCMLDHKVFSAINVVNGDSIQFTYTLTVQSGG
jgi:hypothetical protein